MLVTIDLGPLSLGTSLLYSHCLLTPSFAGLGHSLLLLISPFVQFKTSALLFLASLLYI